MRLHAGCVCCATAACLRPPHMQLEAGLLCMPCDAHRKACIHLERPNPAAAPVKVWAVHEAEGRHQQLMCVIQRLQDALLSML